LRSLPCLRGKRFAIRPPFRDALFSFHPTIKNDHSLEAKHIQIPSRNCWDDPATMIKPRFFYLVPAETRHRLPYETVLEYLKRRLFEPRRRKPVGGVQVIYQHCDMLNRNGYEAYPVHIGEFDIDWYPHETPSISVAAALKLMRESDILIVPEKMPEAAAPFPCKIRIAFVQNQGIVEKACNGRRYEDFGYTSLLACGEYVMRAMKQYSALPCSVVVNGIDLERFKPAPEKRIANRVLYLRRKASWKTPRLAVAKLPPEIAGKLQLVEVPNNQNQDQMAAHYQQADIFIHLGYPTGFALPALEAMACGCAVIGFAGGGGLEHMAHERTALIAPDGDVIALSQALSRVLTDLTLKEKIRAGGMAKAQEFTLARMEQHLLAFAQSCCHADK